jgi:lipopolysaccharide export LptBFGC system permease protein LptF
MQRVAENKSLQVIEFDKYTIELSRTRPRPDRIRRPYERYLNELLYPEADAFLGNRPEELTVEIHARLASPLMILVLTVIALAPFLGPPSGDRVRYPRVAAAFIAGLGVVVANNWAMALALDELSFMPLIYLALALPAGLALGYVRLNPSRLRDLRQWRARAFSRNRGAASS